MNRFSLLLGTTLFFLVTTLSSCEAIAGIFKAGVWTGVIVVALIVGLIIYFIGRGRK
ncbi:MAG: hypothetical protein JWQ27_1685 [Ferruginibacter sp.]|nr:hypothetical protein [Ferruginibacter sp.]